MSDDWGNFDENAGQPAPAQDAHDPFASAAGANAGLRGGVYEPTLEDAIENIKVLATRIVGPTLYAWIGIGVANLVFTLLYLGGFFLLIGGASELGDTAALGAAGGGMLILVVLSFVQSVVMMGLMGSLYAPMKRLMIDGPDAVPDFDTLLKYAKPVVVNCILTSTLVLMIVGFGSIFCLIPGLVAAFFLMMSTYFTAQGVAPLDALKESFETIKAYPMVAVGAVVAFIVCAIAAALGGFVVGMISTVLGEYAIILNQLGSWFFQTLAGFVTWIAFAGVFLTLDTAETGEKVASVFE